MVPDKWGKCEDERLIVYDGDDDAVGEVCRLPFLMNEK